MLVHSYLRYGREKRCVIVAFILGVSAMTNTTDRGNYLGTYRRRIVDSELDHLLAELPARLLDGPKAVGKTEAATGVGSR
jgi:hypothetical protein